MDIWYIIRNEKVGYVIAKDSYLGTSVNTLNRLSGITDLRDNHCVMCRKLVTRRGKYTDFIKAYGGFVHVNCAIEAGFNFHQL